MSEKPKFTFTKEQLAKAALAVSQVHAKAGIPMPSVEYKLLEQKGWQEWLMTLFPFYFEEAFSKQHIQYWDLHWKCLMDIRSGRPLDAKEATRLLILGRGIGKSSTTEAGRVMRAALLKKGYSLIISETDDQAQEHLGNCRVLIEHPDSQLLKYYPHMAVGDGGELLKGMPTADRKEMFITKSGYIFRSKGLAAKMRGLRVGVHRPDDLNFDDVDDVNDSLAVSENKLRLITSSILPVQARKNVTIDISQNLISEHSVVNKIYTGKTDALANRTIIGVANAFEKLDIDSSLDETGKMRHTILETSVPSWSGLDIQRAQKFLDNSGLQTFLAEYQNQFDQFKSGKVIPEYDENAQIITWSQFEKVFGERRIPRHWKASVGLDVGYSEGLHPHWSAWDFIATAGMNSGMGGTLFVYRSRSFKGTSIDDQAEAIQRDLYIDKDGVNYERDEMLISWQMSHERTGEMLTLWQKYNLPFGKFRYYKAEDGVAQWRHMSRTDKKKPHPFKDDTQNEDGTWVIGCPSMFYIVDDEQIVFAQDDNGMKLLRDQVASWEYVTVKLTESGITQQKPSKTADDHCFVAGTQIKTLRGNVAIENINLSDWVLTRDGYRRVIKCGITNLKASVTFVRLSDGRLLQGTRNHPIFIENKGFVPLAKSVKGDRLILWQNQNRLFLMASYLDGILNRYIAQHESIFKPIGDIASKALVFCTEKFGSLSMGRFLKDMSFIIKMKIRSIMTFLIWLASLLVNTLGYIPKMQTATPNGFKMPLSDEQNHANGHLNHWNDKKNTASAQAFKKGMFCPNERLFAPNVPKHLNQVEQLPNFALTNADKPIGITLKMAKPLIRLSAYIVGRNKKQLSKLKNTVIQDVGTPIDGHTVYNLTVAGKPEYFANGILVHNCDVVKSLVCWFGQESTPLSKQEQAYEAIPEKFRDEAQLDNLQKQARYMFLQRQGMEQDQKPTESRFAI